jgi:asparagine synthase (glutamine-hydrolysing)
MCGIIGTASTSSIKNRKWLKIGRDLMGHRGPDSYGEYWSDSGKVGFGHRRLSILDLSEGGNQPMLDLEKETIIVLNGEIYNYKEIKSELCKNGFEFKTKTDTEVILNAWKKYGKNCVSIFNGMFAFAIYDLRKQTIFIARDRAGEKPIFYQNDNGSLHFSSELKGLLANKSIDRKICKKALDCYLSMGYVPNDLSIIDKVKKLPQGHHLTFNLNTGESVIEKYWALPSEINTSMEEPELLERFDYLIKDSVKKQLQADVPVGILLSGGLDSSIITAIAADMKENVSTFTVAFPDDKKYDESSHASLIAEYYNTNHHQLNSSSIKVDILNELSFQFDEPIIDSSMVPTYLVSKEISKYCKVALGGDGGDELFGGYEHYSRLLWTEKYLNNNPGLLRKSISKLSKYLLPIGFKGLNWLQSLSVDYNHSLPIISSFFDYDDRRKLLIGIDYNYADKIRSDLIPDENDLLRRMTIMDYKTYLVEDILVKVDRASMLTSLEVRAPLLDYRIIEFAYKLDSQYKANVNIKKIFLKKYAKLILPNSFNYNRKQGFSIPLNRWLMGGEWRTYFQDVLMDQNCLFNRNIITKLFKGLDFGMNNSERLFGLVMFELWRNNYSIRV